jgi:hypothetical protein
MPIDVYPSPAFSTANAVLGYAEVKANQTGLVSGAWRDITGLSVTVFVPLGRTIKITAHAGLYNAVASTNQAAYLGILEGSTQLQVSTPAMMNTSGTFGDTAYLDTTLILYPSAGVHTYKAGAYFLSGTNTMVAGTDAPAFILVEDVTGGTGGTGPIHLAYAEVTASQGSIGSPDTDITGLSGTVAVPAGRRLRIHASAHLTSSVAGDEVDLMILEGSTRLQERVTTIDTATRLESMYSVIVVSPTAGTHTYKVAARRSVGTGTITMSAAATYPAFILIEDITGTPMSVENVAWTSYTPVWTSSGGATGGGTIVGYYQKLGRDLDVQIDFTYAGGMTLPAGNYFLSIPAGLTIASGRYAPGAAMYHGAGANRWAGTCSPFYAAAGGTKLAIQWHGIAAAWGQNVPMSPAVADIVTLSARLETTT